MNHATSAQNGNGYRFIARALQEQIRSGEYVPGAMLPTEKELQAAFGVSRSTVRRALANLVESGWARPMPKRGVAAMQGSSTELRGNVAYVDHTDMVNQRVFFGISRALRDTGLHLTHVDSRTHGVEGAIEYAVQNGFVAAFVWSKVGFPDRERIEAVQRSMPIIAVDHRLTPVKTDLISEQNLEGAATAVRHLAAQGRKRIAISGMMDMLEVNHDRFSGYLKGLFESGLTPHPVDFQFCVTSGGGPEELELLVHRLRGPDRPDAIFVLQDMCVPVVVQAVFEAGLRIPEDIAIAAFGGEMPIRIDEVGLTSMVVDWPQFSEECVRVLKERLAFPIRPFAEIELPATLVVGGSCGAPAEQWDSPTGLGVSIQLGPDWRVPNEYLQLRFDSSGRTRVP